MITGFISVILFKFVFSNIEGIGAYLKELDVLAPSFALAMIVGYIVSKIFPHDNTNRDINSEYNKL